MNILNYIENLENPIIFDRDNKFLYFPINKNAQISICRNILKHRCILRKDSLDKWIGYQKNLTEESIYEYFKFGVIRNPYDRFVSAYFYLLKKNKLPKHDSIDSFIKNYFPLGDFYNAHFQKQKPQLYYNDKLIVDYLARLETIDMDWEIISQKIDYPSNMVWKNKSTHTFNLADELSIEHREIIYNYYEEDFNTLGYDK